MLWPARERGARRRGSVSLRVWQVIPPTGDARGDVDTRVQVMVERADAEVSLELQQAFFADIASRYPGWEPASSQPVKPSDLAPPDGIWLVAYRDGHAIGCGGLQRFDGETGEVRRIFLDPTERGRGAGRRLLVELEEHARRFGYKRVRLTTGKRRRSGCFSPPGTRRSRRSPTAISRAIGWRKRSNESRRCTLFGASTQGGGLMPRVAPSALGESTADRVMGHRPELLEAWANRRNALFGSSSTLSPQLKEEVRAHACSTNRLSVLRVARPTRRGSRHPQRITGSGVRGRCVRRSHSDQRRPGQPAARRVHRGATRRDPHLDLIRIRRADVRLLDGRRTRNR